MKRAIKSCSNWTNIIILHVELGSLTSSRMTSGISCDSRVATSNLEVFTKLYEARDIDAQSWV